jgi:hypothetical protein
MGEVIETETRRAKTLGWVASVLGTIAFAAFLLTTRFEISGNRFPERLAFTYYAFYLPGLCFGAAGLAVGLTARPLGSKEGDARREAVIGIVLSVIAIAGLAIVHSWGPWFVGAKS